ncbi:MAG: hypothetical protein AB7O66_02185, partial [Limisphaerales bacterium]
PLLWIELANDTRRSDRDRTTCVVLLFLRHFRPGNPIPMIGKIPGAQDWFSGETLRNASVFSAKSVGASIDQSAFQFQLGFMQREQCGVEFSVSKTVDLDEIISVLNGRASSEGFRLVDVSP